MKLHQDIREFIELCLSRKVEFLLVGGYALAFQGAPRFTEDIDLMVLVSPENADKLHGVLADFGFGEVGINRDDFLHADQVIQLGRAPNRVDILIMRGPDGHSTGFDSAAEGYLRISAFNSRTNVEEVCKRLKALVA